MCMCDSDLHPERVPIDCLIQDELERSQFASSFKLRIRDENVKTEDYPAISSALKMATDQKHIKDASGHI